MSDSYIKVTDEFVSVGDGIINRLWDNLPDSDADIDCPIKDCIRFVLHRQNGKTFKYILITQLLGKAVDSRVNILAMQAQSELENSWDARKLCEDAITIGGFEENALENILGSTRQPYNNSPGQFKELSKSNASSPALAPIRDSLVDNLPLITTSQQAESALTYCLIELRDQIEHRSQQNPLFTFDDTPQDMARAKRALLEIAGLGRNGEGLSLATAMLLHVTLGETIGLMPRLYRVNSSTRGRGDVDLYDGDIRYATFELKDKPFGANEVIDYVKKTIDEGCFRFTFVYGPNSGGAPSTIFTDSDRDFLEERGMVASCVSFEALLSSLLLVAADIDLNNLYEACELYANMAVITPAVVNKARKILRDLAD